MVFLHSSSGTIRATQEVHDAPSGGHLGREKTYARLTEMCIGMTSMLIPLIMLRAVSSVNRVRLGHTVADLLRPLLIPSRR